MKLGYARVSRTEQNLDLQTDALTKAGAEKIFVDKVSGAKAERPGLSQLFDAARPGDTIIIWKHDRLARSLQTSRERCWDWHTIGAPIGKHDRVREQETGPKVLKWKKFYGATRRI